jgi:hypothetical protein
MRPVLLYILLVGLPALGVVGVLHAGKNLKPPVFLGGTWSLRVSAEVAGARPCGDSAIRLDGSTLTIFQSGPTLLITIDGEQKTLLEGEIKDLAVTASLVEQSVDKEGASSRNAIPIYMEARVDQQAGHDFLPGLLKLTGCSAFEGIPFVATRQPVKEQQSGD